MAPKTRAASKRKLDDGSSPQQNSGPLASARKKVKETAKPSATAVSATAKGKVERPHSLFQTLPAELRNRIYEFATEPEFKGNGFKGGPRLLKHETSRRSDRRISNDVPMARAFFNLTQVNKQIRSEFRPLWLRNSSFRIKYKELNAFLATFFPATNEIQNAPKILQISWGDDSDYKEDIRIDLSPLLRLRAHSSTLRYTFVPNESVEDMIGYEDHLQMCDNPIDCDTCMEKRMVVEEFEVEYGFLCEINAILANDNQLWLNDIREKKHQIKFSMDFDVDPVPLFTVHLYLFKETVPACLDTMDKKEMQEGAKRYLDETGLRTDDYETGLSADDYHAHVFYAMNWKVGVLGEVVHDKSSGRVIRKLTAVVVG